LDVNVTGEGLVSAIRAGNVQSLHLENVRAQGARGTSGVSCTQAGVYATADSQTDRPEARIVAA